MKFDPAQLPSKPNPNWRETCKIFMSIKPLLKEDLLQGKNGVEKMTTEEIFGKSSQTAKIFKFGKYNGKSYEWVKEHDEQYFDWCIGNVKGFKQ